MRVGAVVADTHEAVACGSTLGDALLRTAKLRPEHEVLVMPEGTWIYAELAERAERVARSLIGLGVAPGDHVGVLIPNSFEYLAATFGISLAGATVVPINARHRAVEISYVVRHAELRAIVTSDMSDDYVDFAALLATAFPDLDDAEDPSALALREAPCLRSVVVLGRKSGPGLLEQMRFDALGDTVDHAAVADRTAIVTLRDRAMLLYTSGTTSNPRGAELSHEALTRVWAGVAARLRVTAEDRMWVPGPMFHIGAFGATLACVLHGATVMTGRFYEAEAAVDLLSRERSTCWFPAFPQMVLGVTNHPRADEVRMDAVRWVVATGAPDALRGLQATVGHATVASCFGMTETSGCSTIHDLDDPLDVRCGTVGAALPGLEMRIVDPATRRPPPRGAPGEVQLRGPLLCDGYWRQPELTAELFVADGWMATGDWGVVDEAGRLSYLGRLKELIRVGGENVAPPQIEGHLMTHPAVHFAQVVGVPDDRLDEVPIAFVELKPGHTASAEDLLAHCRGQIARFKVPREVRFVTEWPMSATKIQRFRLREQYLAEQQ